MDALWQSLLTFLHTFGVSPGSAVHVSDKLDLSKLLALAAVLGWASGFRLYAVVFITGMAQPLISISVPLSSPGGTAGMGTSVSRSSK